MFIIKINEIYTAVDFDSSVTAHVNQQQKKRKNQLY